MTADPSLSGSDLAAGSVSCNRCNAARPAAVHPCPACLCPEHSLSAADREAEARKLKRRPRKEV
jgi:hypothetical protein